MNLLRVLRKRRLRAAASRASAVDNPMYHHEPCRRSGVDGGRPGDCVRQAPQEGQGAGRQRVENHDDCVGDRHHRVMEQGLCEEGVVGIARCGRNWRALSLRCCCEARKNSLCVSHRGGHIKK